MAINIVLRAVFPAIDFLMHCFDKTAKNVCRDYLRNLTFPLIFSREAFSLFGS
jgi:hypothetical protein